MPILCPGGTLWRLGKYTRHGGHTAHAQKPHRTPRQVQTQGSLAHPFSQKQVDLGPAMSPGSTGGVYMGPEKTTKGTSDAARDVKLAQIRSPTKYYTDGDVFIGQDDVTTKEGDKVKGQPLPDEPTEPDDRRYNDTLNPDGTNASILFFEETFMSAKFSHLSTSSPRTLPNASRTMPKRVPTSPAKRSRGGVRANGSSRLDDSVTTGTYSQGNKNQRSTIPSWVRQRRCLPTIDDVDFEHIDDISLHSLSANEGRANASPEKRITSNRHSTLKVKDNRPGGHGMEVGNKYKVTNNNYFNNKGDNITRRSDAEFDLLGKMSKDSRSVLGDLTNKNEAPLRSATKAQRRIPSFKMPRRNSAAERLARRNRKTGSRRSRSSSRDRLINGMDKLNEHTYVNLEYIAGIMTDSPPRDKGHKDGEQTLHVDHKQPRSPSKEELSKSAKNRKELFITAGARKDKEKQSTVEDNRRRLDEPNAKSSFMSFVSLSTDDSDRSLLLERCVPASSARAKRTGFVNGVQVQPTLCREARKEKLSSTSSWESATNSHSTEGDECAAILSADAKTKMVTKRLSFPTYREGNNERQKGLKKQTETANIQFGGRPRAGREANNIQGKEDVTKIVDNPSYTENSVRKARIVRTNSIEERTVEPTNARGKPRILDGQKGDQAKNKPFIAKTSTHIETRRSLPAPASSKMCPEQTSPQRRSTTNVRAVETKLSQKQKRKIRRTIEGDEVLAALVSQETTQPGISEGFPPPEEVQPRLEGIQQGDTKDVFEIMPRDSTDRDEIDRVQKIVNDWNRGTNGGSAARPQTTRQAGTRYVGTHVHPVPDLLQINARTHQPIRREQHGRTPGDVFWSVTRDGTRENKGQGALSRYPAAVGGNAAKIPPVSSGHDKKDSRRSVPSSVIEIYLASQPYSPAEPDEIDVQQGEILVVNSSMQRENDWMWVYVPRSDRFGYLPAFAARPLEFEVNQI